MTVAVPDPAQRAGFGDRRGDGSIDGCRRLVRSSQAVSPPAAVSVEHRRPTGGPAPRQAVQRRWGVRQPVESGEAEPAVARPQVGFAGGVPAGPGGRQFGVQRCASSSCPLVVAWFESAAVSGREREPPLAAPRQVGRFCRPARSAASGCVPLGDLLADQRDDVAAEIDGVVVDVVAAGGQQADAEVVVVEQGRGDGLRRADQRGGVAATAGQPRSARSTAPGRAARRRPTAASKPL